MTCRLLLVAVAGLALGTGCRHRCCRPCDSFRPAPFRPPAPPGPPASGRPYLLPPAGVPTIPAPEGLDLVPPVGPGAPADPRNYPPPVLGPAPTNPAPARPPAEILLPDPIPGNGSSRSWSSPGDAGYNILGGPARPSLTAEPPVTAANPVTPVGLPGFVRVSDGLAAGGRPTLDGFDSLKRSGYRAVVFLHGPGADVSAAQDVAGGRGLSFVPIAVSPQALAEAVERFNAVVGDRANRPAYVYSDAPARAGITWYLHFRTVEAMNDDAARIRAKPLGLTGEGESADELESAARRWRPAR